MVRGSTRIIGTGGIGGLGKIESSGQITEEKYTEH
jgi:hypothetical protein